MSRSDYDRLQYLNSQHAPQEEPESPPPNHTHVQRMPSHSFMPNPFNYQNYAAPYDQGRQQRQFSNPHPVDVDSSFYDDPYGDSHRARRHQSPAPIPGNPYEVDSPEVFTSFPEAPDQYLLQRMDHPTVFNQEFEPKEDMPHPTFQQHNFTADGRTNFYQGANESDYIAAEDVDNFQPFPIAGDNYQLNEFDNSTEETEYDDTESQFSGTTELSDVSMPSPDMAGGAAPYHHDPNMGHYPPGMPPDTGMPMGAGDQYYGPPIPPMMGAQPPRPMNTKNVKLYKGNLVLDCPLPTSFINKFAEAHGTSINQREFTYMRYSAATCDPNDFSAREFTLRQKCYNVPRETEILIAITIYNENELLLARTLQGVFKNIKHLVMRNNSKTWGPDSWKKVVVCVIADGRKKIDKRSQALMARLGVYQDGLAKNLVGNQDVHAHIYEYTTMCGIKSVDKTVQFAHKKTVPIQMIFCMKEKNQKKINSHRWFFNAFGRILNPKVCVLLDAGTEPAHDSIYHLWKAFDTNPRIGGACGEIRAGLGKGWSKLFNPLVAAQNFEYKMSNILDKPMESMFGFITVLPGAFSAYRYEALQNDSHGHGPLEKYFKGEALDRNNAGIFEKNMYLAEDRVLCFELVAKRNENWLLKYVKSAHAVTDVPEALSELVLQRRRWLNGSFFAAIYSISHALSLWRSRHSLLRKLFLHFEFLYQTVAILFSWFSIGNFFLVFRILTNSLGDPSMGFGPGKVLGAVFLWMYCACIITTFVLSFGNRPPGTQPFYIIVVIFFAVLMAYLLFAAIYISVKSVSYALCMNGGQLTTSLIFSNPLFRDLVVSLLSTYALYFVSSFMFFEPWHMFTSFLQYILLSPSYINVFNVYAFCNIHDISWGTKGDDGKNVDLGAAKMSSDGKKLEVEVPTSLSDIDRKYNESVQLLEKPHVDIPYENLSPAAQLLKQEEIKSQKEESNKDYYALFRSSVVLIWIFTNLIVVIVVLNLSGLEAVDSDSTSTSTSTPTSAATAESLTRLLSRRTIENVSGYIAEVYELVARQAADSGASDNSQNCTELGSGGSTIRTEIYLTVILWCVAALAAYRFIGAMLYLLFRLFGH